MNLYYKNQYMYQNQHLLGNIEFNNKQIKYDEINYKSFQGNNEKNSITSINKLNQWEEIYNDQLEKENNKMKLKEKKIETYRNEKRKNHSRSREKLISKDKKYNKNSIEKYRISNISYSARNKTKISRSRDKLSNNYSTHKYNKTICKKSGIDRDKYYNSSRRLPSSEYIAKNKNEKIERNKSPRLESYKMRKNEKEKIYLLERKNKRERSYSSNYKYSRKNAYNDKKTHKRSRNDRSKSLNSYKDRNKKYDDHSYEKINRSSSSVSFRKKRCNYSKEESNSYSYPCKNTKNFKKNSRNFVKNFKKYESISSRSRSLDRNSSNSSCSSSSRSNIKDAGHYDFKEGTILNNKYKIIKLLGDGTFGRCLECLNLHDKKVYGIKIIRPVPRYIESAKYEADIINEILINDFRNESHIVNMTDHFYFDEKRKHYMALVFEKLGKSLYDFIKMNNYRGFPLDNIRSITKQVLEGLSYIHDKLKIVHTDLKPENILLKIDKSIEVKEKKKWPLNVTFKENKLRRSTSPSTRSYSKEKNSDVYFYPVDDSIKLIDFGGATRENERHSEIINTRQYRAPEVILGCCQWNEKSDVWCIGCIFAELYTGELLFPTHDNEEHICLLEKMSGPIPLWMANSSKKEFRRMFNLNFEMNDEKFKVDFSKLYGKREVIKEAVSKLETLNDLIPEKHSIFKRFLKDILIIDPLKRPSCKDILNHEFFRADLSHL